MKRNILFLIITLAFALGVSSCKFNKIRKGSLREKYDAAIKYYEKKDYYKAGLLLEEVIPLIVGTKESEIAQFYYGYCHYNQNQLALAAHYFQKFYETFRNSQYAEEARYMHVKSLYDDSPPYNLDQTNTLEAINATQSFLNNFANSNYVEECNKILKELRKKLERKAFENAKLYYKINNFQSAVISFINFQKGFPDSDYNEEVAYLKLEAQYRYAKKSIEKKQKERFEQIGGFYESFIESYPASRFLKDVQNIYEKSLSELKKSNNTFTTSNK